MAQATISATSSGVDLVSAWKETYTALMTAFNFDCEEYELAETIPEVSVDWTHFNTIMPLDLLEKTGVSSLPEGGWKSRPSSKDLVRATIELQHLNTSFTNSELARWADRGEKNQVMKQLKLQGGQSVNAMKRGFADYFHGTSTGVLALTDTNISGTSVTATLHSGYGNAAITSGAFITDKFRVGEYVAVIDGSDLETNAIGLVSAINSATPSITINPFIGSVSETNNNLKIVKANSMENETLAGTDFNRGLVGMQDVLFTQSVHAVSSGTYADHSVARSISSGGRYTGVKFRAARDAIRNYAPAQYKPDILFVDQGVQRDMIAYERAGLRHNSAWDLEIDGQVKSKGFTIFDSRRVMPASATVGCKKSLGKVSLLKMPDGQGGLGWEDAEKLENRSVYRFDLDMVVGLVWKCRKAWAVETGLTQQ